MSTPATIVINSQGIIKYASESVLVRSGFALAQVIDRSPKQLWGGHMPQQTYKRLWDDISNGNPHVATLRNKSASEHWYTSQFHIMPIFDQDGATPYYVGIDAAVNTGHIHTEQFLHVWRSGTVQERYTWWADIFGMQATIDSLHTWVSQTWIMPTHDAFRTRYSDAQLITEAQEDSTLFGAVYTKYHADVYQYIFSKVYQHAPLAEDLTQETFVKAFQYLPTYTAGYATYQTYLYRIAYSRIVDHMRRQKVTTQPLDAVTESSWAAHEDANQVDISLLLDRAKVLLTPAEYQTIEAFYIHQDSIRDISIGMARSQNAIKLLLSRARKKLSKGLPHT